MAQASIGNLPGTNQVAGNTLPQHVMLVDTGGDPVAIGGGTQYTEDAAATGNPVGNAVILVRSDTPSTTVSANGDNVAQRGTDYGAAYVTLLDASGNTVAVGGGTQYTEDAAAAANPVGTVPIMVRVDTPAAAVTTDGDNIAQRGSNFGAAYVTLVDSSGGFASPGGGTPITSTMLAGSTTVALDFDSGGGSVPVPVIGIALPGSGGPVAGGTATNPLHVSGVTSTAGGWTPNFKLSTGSGDATVIKNSAGQVGYLFASNINASPRYLKLYDKSTAPDAADTPKHIFIVPGNTAGAGFSIGAGAGAAFTSGIGFRLTTGAPSTDANGVAANELIVNYGYK